MDRLFETATASGLAPGIIRYRKKPVVIEAFRPGFDLRPEWFYHAVDAGIIYSGPNGELKIKTLEGIHTVSPGDYIIKGVKGEIYPCKPDIFEMTYEEAEN